MTASNASPEPRQGLTPTDLLARGLMVPDLTMPKRLWTVTALMGNDKCGSAARDGQSPTTGADLRPRHTATLPAFTMGEALQTTVAQLRAEGWAHEMGEYWWTVRGAGE